MELKMKISEFANKDDNCKRKKILTEKSFGTLTEEESTGEETETIERKENKTKKQKFDEVWSLPNTESEIIEVIKPKMEKNIEALMVNLFSMLNPNKEPPEGRRGLTRPSTIVRVHVDNIKIENIKRDQFIQLHPIIGRKGCAVADYADVCDVSCDVKILSMLDEYPKGKLLLEKITPFIHGGTIGAFRGSAKKGRITLV